MYYNFCCGMRAEVSLSPLFGHDFYILLYLLNRNTLYRIVAFGFLQNQGAYLRDSWNVLDFIIVIVSIVDVLTTPAPSANVDTLMTTDASFGALKALRALRALRPLRAARAFPGIRVVVSLVDCLLLWQKPLALRDFLDLLSSVPSLLSFCRQI